MCPTIPPIGILRDMVELLGFGMSSREAEEDSVRRRFRARVVKREDAPSMGASTFQRLVAAVLRIHRIQGGVARHTPPSAPTLCFQSASIHRGQRPESRFEAKRGLESPPFKIRTVSVVGRKRRIRFGRRPSVRRFAQSRNRGSADRTLRAVFRNMWRWFPLSLRAGPLVSPHEAHRSAVFPHMEESSADVPCAEYCAIQSPIRIVNFPVSAAFRGPANLAFAAHPTSAENSCR